MVLLWDSPILLFLLLGDLGDVDMRREISHRECTRRTVAEVLVIFGRLATKRYAGFSELVLVLDVVRSQDWILLPIAHFDVGLPPVPGETGTIWIRRGWWLLGQNEWRYRCYS